MAIKKMNIKNHEYLIDIHDETATIKFKKSEIKITNEKELIPLSLTDINMASVKYELSEDSLKLEFAIPKSVLSFADIQKETEINRLRAASNLQHLEKFVESDITFFVHPENLFFNYNMEPVILYRGIEGKMLPNDISKEEFLDEYKAAAISIFDAKSNYEVILNSKLDRVKKTKFNQDIIKTNSSADLTDMLLKMLQEQTKIEKSTKKSISKRRYRIMQQTAIWLGVVTMLCAIPLAYVLTTEVPFQQKMLDADTAFLKKDYEQVIQGLTSVKSGDLRNTERYELAYSYVQGKSLSDDQKNNIKNNINLKANQDYLNYWIENGRGNLDKALDLAKKVQDPDLILYGYVQKIESVKKNPNLSGTKRETQLNKYQQEYDKYKKQYSSKKSDN